MSEMLAGVMSAMVRAEVVQRPQLCRINVCRQGPRERRGRCVRTWTGSRE